MKCIVNGARGAPAIVGRNLSIAVALAALLVFTPHAEAKTAPATQVHAKAKPAAKKKTKSAPELPKSDTAVRVAEWVADSNDSNSLPYVVIDKQAAMLFLYDAHGKLLGSAPVLIGLAKGDEATPGVGHKTLAQLGPAEKTTPAGRYYAKYGKAIGHEQMLWVDYSLSVALHPVVTTNPKERRMARIQSLTPDDNRITFGCINVPATFYSKKIRPRFLKKGGMVYILPETKSLEDVFPLMRGWTATTASLG